MGWLKKLIGRNPTGSQRLSLVKDEILRGTQASASNHAPRERSTAAKLRCSRCGKASSGNQIVFGSTSRFLDLVGQCQKCRLLICGGCAVKEEFGKLTQFKCPKCSGLIGPRFSWEL